MKYRINWKSLENEINPVLISTMMSLDALDNLTLSAANLALNFFGVIDKNNISFATMLKLSLIKEDGKAHDHEILLEALSRVINERVGDGSFV